MSRVGGGLYVAVWGVSVAVAMAVALLASTSRAFSLPHLPVTHGNDIQTLEEVKESYYYDEDNFPDFQGCSEGMVPCHDSVWCYTSDQQCDGIVNCPDASDETSCSCVDRIPEARRCDDTIDCPDSSDELGCYGCQEGQLWCLSNGSSTCVEASEVCDGTELCDDGRDEANCWRLTLRRQNRWDNVTVRTQGLLQVKRLGEWRAVCGHRNQNLSRVVNHLCHQVVGEDRDGKNKYKLVPAGPSPSGSSRWAHLHSSREHVYLSKRCSSTLAVYVNCANPRCVNTRPRKDLVSRGRPDRVRRDHSSSSRIVGGKDSPPDVWTFLVGIKRNGVFICGGSIITAQWILSAGHCFVRFRKMLYEVQAGMLRRRSWSPFEQTRRVSHVVRHEEFEVTHLFHDLVLVKLQTPLQLNRWVRPVCLAFDIDLKMGTLCTVAGWGNILEDGDLADSLQEVQLPTLDTCTRDFMLVSDEQVVCAGYPEGLKDACQGDSGGPMMCNGTEGWVQAGVVSYGRGCARAKQPGVYSRLTHYRPWIQEKLDKMKDPLLLPKEGPVTTCDGIQCKLAVGSCLPRKYLCDRMVDCLGAEDESQCPEFYSRVPSGEPTTTTTSYSTILEPTTLRYTTDPRPSDSLYMDNTDTATVSSSAPTESTATTDYYTTSESFPVTDDASETSGNSSSSTYRQSSPCTQQQLRLDSILDVQCSKNQFVCEDLKQCLPWESVCDGVRHCRDGTDEIGCSCLDRLLKFREDLDCDGYFDCFDLTDETCDLCGEDFLCPRSRVCLAQDLVCNTKTDCEYGEDELNCIGLVEEAGVLQYDRFGELAHHSHGTLVLRSGLHWTTICVNHLPEQVGLNVCSYLGYSKLAEVSYAEGPKSLEPQPSARSAATPKHPDRTAENFLQRPEGRMKHKRSVAPGSRRISEEWRRVNGSEGGAPSDGLRFLRQLKDLSQGSRIRRDVCTQAVVSCERQACGKAPLYFFSSETPVWMPGGAPWAASVYVEGHYRCGATLVRPRWAIASRACMAGVRLESSMASVVMGSWRSIGEPTRLWGGHEHDRRVVYMRVVDDTDILMLRLAHRMPKTPYINHLCLPSKSVTSLEGSSWCAAAGRHDRLDRINVAVGFHPSDDCPDGYICPQHDQDDDLPCMRSWSGVVACQYTHGTNPTWVGVGVWAYQDPAADCHTAQHHPLFNLDIILTIHSIIEGYTPEPLAQCDGETCVTGVCVTAEDRCDANLSCPDLADEPPTCPNPITMCRPDFETGLCVCPEGKSPCRDGACVPDEKICDGVPDCPEAVDEENCVCCRHQGTEKLCDGHLDCPDQSDEQFCGCKPETEYFRCYKSGPKCINRSEVCDGLKQCPGGEDERHCVTLAPAIIVDENVLGIPEMPPQGYLVVRLSGVWYTYLSAMWEAYLSHLVCIQIGYSRAKSTEERSLNLEMVGKATRSVTQGNFNGILFFPGSLQRAGDMSRNSTVVYIHCLETDLKADSTTEVTTNV